MKRLLSILACVMLTLLAISPAPLHAAPASIPIAPVFRDYYARHQGMRILGPPISDLLNSDGIPAQYFEKGRLEDHRGATDSTTWAFMYGRLTAELLDQSAADSVNNTALRYADLATAHQPNLRVAPPAGFQGGTAGLPQGAFVPFESRLRPAPGYIVPTYFWAFMQRGDLFPAGWLHDFGLPMTGVLETTTVKYGERRVITMQAFERTVLTYDPLNPPGWQIERGNIGVDALRNLAFGQPGTSIEIPAAGAPLPLPLHVLARTSVPDTQLIARIRWQDGTLLAQSVPVLRDSAGQGYIVATLNWSTESQPPQPATQAATLELQRASGVVLARRQFTAVSASDPATRLVKVYWVLGEDVVPISQRVMATPRIGAAALNELLWGPGPPNLAGFTTAIPGAADVLRYPGRDSSWDVRITLRGLTIVDGVATANFSQEMRAYGGGSLRVALIRRQITQTLLQFPTVKSVRIAVEGETEGVLEP